MIRQQRAFKMVFVVILALAAPLADARAKIDKEICIVSLFFTTFTGILLVLISRETSLKEQKRIVVLKNYKNWLVERKENYQNSRKLYVKICNENNKYGGILEKEDSIEEENKLFTSLRNFLNDCKNFNEWSETFIKKELELHKERHENKFSTK